MAEIAAARNPTASSCQPKAEIFFYLAARQGFWENGDRCEGGRPRV
jgi:hypothetical protein